MSDASGSPAIADSPTPSDASSPPTPRQRNRTPSSPPDESSVSGGSSPRNRAGRKGLDAGDAGDDGDDAGLFGDSSGDEQPPVRKRTLNDEELDSGDDEDRRDRMEDDFDMHEERELNTVEISLGRHPVAHATDGELYLLRYSRTVGFEPQTFTEQTFKPPRVGHHSAPPTGAFSSAQTANTSIRWKRDSDDPEILQSNARVIRWSDGSLTLQIAANAAELLELPPKILAPPQQNPSKPTPTSVFGNKAASMAYESRLDSHTYLASIHQDATFVQLTNHATTALTVQANMEENDDALVRLQEQMAAMSKGYAKADQSAGPGVLTVIEDPELAKRKAEIAERDRLRAQKRRETQEQKMRDRQSGVLARSGLRNPYASGLSLGELEASGIPRPRKPTRKPRRRGSEYSEDEDDYRRGRTREDEYDEDDGFVAGSDEEVEYIEDDEADLDRGIEADAVEESDGSANADSKPVRSPKRPREDDEEPSGITGAKRGRRQVLDDDEE